MDYIKKRKRNVFLVRGSFSLPLLYQQREPPVAPESSVKNNKKKGGDGRKIEGVVMRKRSKGGDLGVDAPSQGRGAVMLQRQWLVPVSQRTHISLTDQLHANCGYVLYSKTSSIAFPPTYFYLRIMHSILASSLFL